MSSTPKLDQWLHVWSGGCEERRECLKTRKKLRKNRQVKGYRNDNNPMRDMSCRWAIIQTISSRSSATGCPIMAVDNPPSIKERVAKHAMKIRAGWAREFRADI